MRAWIWGALVAGCVGCGGSSDDGTGTNGSGASAGTGGSAGSGTGGTGGTGTGGSAGSGTGGTGGTGTGGTGGAAQCSENSACVIRPSTCCGQCGVATRGDVIALPSTEVQAYSDSVCSSGGGCPPCAGDADPTLVATCRAGACEVVDLLTDPATGCSSDTDCMLRASACCECGADVSRSGLVAIAVSQFATYSGYVCDSSGVCDGCVPTYPSEAHASCLIGHCTVVWTN